jgi:leucyl-tRNA synthetase
MWQDIGRSPSIFERDWPRYEEQYTEADEVEIVIQVDGTVRERMDVPRDISEEDLKEQVKQNDRVQDFLEGDEPERMIVVPEKLVNVVT